MLALSIFFQFYLSFIFQFIEELKLYKKIIFIFSLFAFYVFFYGITDTADWGMYDNIFNIDDIETDVLFRYLSLLTFALGYTFTDLFKIHILIYGFFLVKFISRFTQNTFLVIGFYVFIAYVHLNSPSLPFSALRDLNCICILSLIILIFFRLDRTCILLMQKIEIKM